MKLRQAPTKTFHFQTDWILFEDDDLIVANKPSGLLSVPGRLPENKTSLVTLLENYCQHPLHIVHRLDMDTSGIMVIAKHKTALRHLNQQFQNRQTFKCYEAICAGIAERQKGRIHLPMRCDWKNRPRQIIDCRNGKHTHTEWVVRHQFDNAFEVSLIPLTGRSHQLRVHMKMLGHPILGDNLYADAHSLQTASRLLLHAAELHFQHPTHQQLMTFCQPGSLTTFMKTTSKNGTLPAFTSANLLTHS